jgi:hypothetical protein
MSTRGQFRFEGLQCMYSRSTLFRRITKRELSFTKIERGISISKPWFYLFQRSAGFCLFPRHESWMRSAKRIKNALRSRKGKKPTLDIRFWQQPALLIHTPGIDDTFKTDIRHTTSPSINSRNAQIAACCSQGQFSKYRDCGPGCLPVSPRLLRPPVHPADSVPGRRPRWGTDSDGHAGVSSGLPESHSRSIIP